MSQAPRMARAEVAGRDALCTATAALVLIWADKNALTHDDLEGVAVGDGVISADTLAGEARRGAPDARAAAGVRDLLVDLARDAQVIRIDNLGFWKPENWVFDTYNALALPITSAATKIAKGAYVCRAGWRTGRRCGEVFSTGFDKYPLENLISVRPREGSRKNICALGGDSGGPVYNVAQKRAYGLVSVGCKTLSEGNFFAFSPITPILNALNVSLVTQ